MKPMMNRNGYSYDVLTNTLNVTASFLKKASVLNSPEYKLIIELRAVNSDVKIVPVENKSKASSKNITFKQMEAYIAIFDNEKKTLNAQFEKVKRMSKIQASPYKYVKVWFEKQFPHYKDQIDFDKDGNIIFAETVAVQEGQNAEGSDDAA